MIVFTGENRTRVEISFQRIGDDLIIAIYGGEKPHIGAVAVATCNEDINIPTKKTSTASVITVAGHMEDNIAKDKAVEIARYIGNTVVVSCGIHSNNISNDEIKDILFNINLLIDEIKDKIKAT